MADRYEFKVMRKGSDGKSYGNRIGVAFPWKGKDGFSLVLDALPIGQMNDKGEFEVRLMMAPPFDKQNKGGGTAFNDDPFGLPDV